MVGQQELVRNGGFVDINDCFQKTDLDFCEQTGVSWELKKDWEYYLKENTSVLCDGCLKKFVLLRNKKKFYFNRQSNTKYCENCYNKKILGL